MNTINKFQLALLDSKDLYRLQGDVAREIQARRTQLKIKRLSKHPEKLNVCPENIFWANSSELLAVPQRNKHPPINNAKYLGALLAQDWSHLFEPSSSDERFYVYVHVDPTKIHYRFDSDCGGKWGGQPFYVGKGTGNRAYDLKRNQGHGKIIKELLNSGVLPEQMVKIVFDGLTESKAFEIESKLIYFLGTIYENTKKRKHGVLVNLDTPRIPEFVGVMSEFLESPFAAQKRRVRKRYKKQSQALTRVPDGTYAFVDGKFRFLKSEEEE